MEIKLKYVECSKAQPAVFHCKEIERPKEEERGEDAEGKWKWGTWEDLEGPQWVEREKKEEEDDPSEEGKVVDWVQEFFTTVRTEIWQRREAAAE